MGRRRLDLAGRRFGLSVSVRKMVLDTIWFGRIGQIVVTVGFVFLIFLAIAFGTYSHVKLQELKVGFGEYTYRECLAHQARSSAELSGAVIQDDEPLCRGNQAKAEDKVVAMYGEFVWSIPLEYLIKAALLWVSLCVFAAAVRFFVREAHGLHMRH